MAEEHGITEDERCVPSCGPYKSVKEVVLYLLNI